MVAFSSSKICWALMIALRAIVASSVEPASAVSSSKRELLNPEPLFGLSQSILLPQYCFKNHTGSPVLAVTTLETNKS